jgi:hypothetical protein
MSEEEVKYLSFDEAANLVAAIQEEEDIHRNDKRVLTVYNHEDREVCWFDFDEVMAEMADVEPAQQKEEAQNYILHHIPDWARNM